MAREMDYIINDIDKVHKVVLKSYVQLGDFENAYYYQSSQIDMMVRIFNPSMVATWVNDLLTLEKEKQEILKKLSEERIKKDEVTIQAQKRLNYLAISTILTLLVFTYLFYRNARAKHRLNIQLIEKQEEILAQTEELSAQTEELRSANEEIEAINANLGNLVRERMRIIKDQNSRLKEYSYFNAHKVRGPLARILGLITIIQHDYPDGSFFPHRELLKKAGGELDDAIKEINGILDGEAEG